MRRKFRLKKKYQWIKYLGFIVVGFFIYLLMTNVIFKLKISDSNTEIIDYLVTDTNPFIERNEHDQIKKIASLFSQFDFNHPISILKDHIYVETKENQDEEGR